MDQTKPFYIDKVTGVYGQAEHLVLVDLTAAERFYISETMSDDERIKYFESLSTKEVLSGTANQEPDTGTLRSGT